MNLRNRLSGARMLLVGALAFSLAGAIPRARGQEQEAEADPSKAIIEYSRSPNDVVIQMEWGSSIRPRLPDSPPQLRIYGDGRVHLHSHWPNTARIEGYDAETAKRKGLAPPSKGRNYGLQLSEGEMAELLSFLAEKGLMDFDREAIKKRMREIDIELGREIPSKGKMFAEVNVIDGDWRTIEINLDSYRSMGVKGPVKKKLNKSIRWYTVAVDARHYPNIAALQGLAEAQKKLKAILNRDDVKKLDEE